MSLMESNVLMIMVAAASSVDENNRSRSKHTGTLGVHQALV